MASLNERLSALGISAPEFRGFITKDNRAQIAQDAALVTTANTLTPAYLGAYIDREAVEILTAPRNARAVFPEVKKGDWGTPFAQFRTAEYTGTTTPYSDFTENTRAGVNYNWPTRKQYRFQTTIDYGDLESEITGLAGVNLVADKQQSAAHVIDVDANKFALLGVTGYEVYGLLNDPSLPARLTPANGAGGSPLWSSKTMDEIYNDILDMYSDMQTQSQGLVDMDSDLALLLPPGLMPEMGKTNAYGNKTAKSLVEEYFGGRIQFITIPEMATGSGNLVMLVARSVMGKPVAEIGFSEKLRMGRVIPQLSSFKQKVSSSTYGTIYYRPYAVVSMLGC